MNRVTFWAVLGLATGVIAALLYTPTVSAGLGWPDLLVFVVIFFSVSGTVYAPVQLRENYATYQLQQSRFPTLAGVSPFGLVALTLTFVVLPVIGFVWLLSFVIR